MFEEIEKELREATDYMTYIGPIQNFKKGNSICVDGYLTIEQLEKLVNILKKVQAINESEKKI